MFGVYNIIEADTERGDNLPEIIHKVLKEKEGSYYTIGFTVPKNVVKITITYDYHRGTKGFMSDLHPTNTIDIGLEDADGRFLGWSGSAHQSIYVGEFGSTHGYLSESIMPGEWKIIVGAYHVAGESVDVKYSIEFEYRKELLLLGDLHIHSDASDGRFDIHTLGKMAQKAKLDSSMTTVMLGVVLFVAVIGIIVWSVVIKKVEVIKIWRLGFMIMAIGFVPLYFAKNLVTAIVIECVMGFGIASCLITMDCIGAKIVDDDYARHGIRREGIINSLVGVMNRLNGLFTSLAFYVTSEVFGFVSGDEPGENPGTAAKMLLCVFPFIAMVCASIFSFFLKFKKDGNNNEQISDN